MENNEFFKYQIKFLLDMSVKSVNNSEEYDDELFDKYLTNKESNILTLLFKKGYTVTEVSKAMNISRQAVNQCKNRSLLKLRNTLKDCI